MIDDEDFKALEMQVVEIESCVKTSDDFDEFRACVTKARGPKTYEETRKAIIHMAQPMGRKKNKV